MIDSHIRNQVVDLLKTVLSQNIKFPKEQIDEMSLFEEYGIDSISALKMTNALEEKFGTLSKTLFFEYQTIGEMADFFMDELHDEVVRAFPYESNNDQREVAMNGQTGTAQEYKARITDSVKEILSQNIKMPITRITDQTSFEECGIDSILAIKMTEQLEEIFGILPKTLFFECQTVGEMTDYLYEDKLDTIEEWFAKEVFKSNEIKEFPATPIYSNQNTHGVSARKVVRKVVSKVEETNKASSDIAIIGLALKCPEADNVDEFWKNLCEAKDCITEIPKERFCVDDYYNSDKNEKGTIYSRWGGFINGVDEFDPMFFNISHKEAATLDPQNRLFLQCAHAAIEDSGYTKDNLDGNKRNVGVFVGALYEEYQLYAAQEQLKGNTIAVGSSLASIANQVSYYCNFNGPSMSLDTMCSSAVTALNLACNSLKLGECNVAIAGGVNISIHPNKYLSLSVDKFLSTNGKCMSFGSGGDGFVPSEGVCALILKPLHKAKKDGDQIYGVIKGISMNHGGKTSGFTVPNPSAQTAIIRNALDQSGVNAREISYLEAHGTGTSLGDPIEIKGLTKAFREDTKDNQFCYIGSVKSNIGHCESAAGIISIAKVLLQMKYGKLVPSIHSEVLNPYIDFEETPFKVSRDLQEWKRPVLNLDGTEKEYPRIAGISSFGAGGSNVHLILQEYQDDREEYQYDNNPYIILISAKRKEQLVEYIKNIKEYVMEHKLTDQDMPSIAYCLQTGREAMDYRIGFTVRTMDEFKEKLELLEYDITMAGAFIGDKWANVDMLASLQEKVDSVVDELLESKEYEQVISMWVKGVSVDWTKRYQKVGTPKKISLPTYPFAKEKYWYTDIKVKKRAALFDQTHTDNTNIEVGKEKPERKKTKEQSMDLGKKVENDIKGIINEILEIPTDLVESAKNFEALGFNSMSLVEFSVMLTEKFGVNMTPDTFYSYSTVRALRNYLIDEHSSELSHCYSNQEDIVEDEGFEENDTCEGDKNESPEGKDHEEPIQVAIVGISGRFPGANNTQELWDILREGKETISQMPFERAEWRSIYENIDSEKSQSRRLGVLSNIDKFDPAFFEISPREAINMDPKQRILLEEMWRALEDAGYSNKTVEENMGVYVGAEESNYHELIKDISITANHNAVLAARLAYFLNIRGANMTINTACSSSLVAFHQAVLSIRSGESDSAVVGGANVIVKPDNYLAMEGAGMISTDGRCYAFDKRANGMVPAEAVAVVVLKRLDKAVKDGNHIYATVAGSGVNYDGRTNGITAPSGISQTNLIETVYNRFHINPAEVSYIVTHGTGTNLGDSIESNALYNAYKKYTDQTNYCALTSNKPNIGHALAASGLVSIINLVLAMKHETIPASIHCEQENNYINWKNSPFYVNRHNKKWDEKENKPRYGAVSAFGMSGTNAHVVLKSYHADPVKVNKVPAHLFVFSAKNENVLQQILGEYRAYFESKDTISNEELQSISYTLMNGRSHFRFRCAIIAKDYHEMLEMLRRAERTTKENNIFFGKVEKNFEEAQDKLDQILLLKECLLKDRIEAHQYHSILEKLAELYVSGYEDLWNDVNPGLLSLPTYPFVEKVCWPNAKTEHTAVVQPAQQKVIPEVERPVVERPVVEKPVRNMEEKVIAEQTERSGIKLVHLVPTQSFVPISKDVQRALNVGKIQLRSLTKEAEIEVSEEQNEQSKPMITLQQLIPELVQSLAEELYCGEDEIDLESSFIELGLDSITGVEWVSRLNKTYGLNLKRTKLYQYTSVVEFAKYIQNEVGSGQSNTNVMIQQNKPVISEKSKARQQHSLIDEQAILKELIKMLAEELFLEEDEIDLESSFTEMGLDSIIGVEFVSKINKKYALNIKATQLYNFVSVLDFMKQIITQVSVGQTVSSDVKVERTKEETSIKENQKMHEELVQSLIRSLAEELYMEESEIDVSESFIELGLDSIIGVEWIGKVNKEFGLHINTTKIYQYPNIIEFATYIESELGVSSYSPKETIQAKPKSQEVVSPVKDTPNNTFEELLKQIYDGDIEVDDALVQIQQF